MSQGLWIAIAVIAVLVIAVLVVGLVRYRRRQVRLRPATDTAIEAATPADRSGGYTASSGINFTQSSGVAPADRSRSDAPGFGAGLPGVGDDAAVPRDSVRRPISEVRLPEVPAPAGPDVEAIAPSEGRLERLRGRLAKSQNAFGRSILGLLGGGDLDEDSWAEIEDTLLIADLGPVTTASV
ncbi:MAG: signal recognition particle-docking protein FtsY, partial [Mycobacteriaceae bacterium]